MELFKNICITILLICLFSGCSSVQNLQTKAPIDYDEVYCENWVAGIKEGGTGINLFIPISGDLTKSVRLDSVYYRGKGVLLQKIKGEIIVYVGRFNSNRNQKSDIVMSSDPNEEYGNQIPILEGKIPFELKDSECVISYKEGNVTKYFKIENIIEKQPQHYPSAPNKQ